jgi:hypothetical protein
VDARALGEGEDEDEVLIAMRLVMGSAVKRVPSTVEELGATVVIRMLLSVIRPERK